MNNSKDRGTQKKVNFCYVNGISKDLIKPHSKNKDLSVVKVPMDGGVGSLVMFNNQILDDKYNKNCKTLKLNRDKDYRVYQNGDVVSMTGRKLRSNFYTRDVWKLIKPNRENNMSGLRGVLDVERLGKEEFVLSLSGNVTKNDLSSFEGFPDSFDRFEVKNLNTLGSRGEMPYDIMLLVDTDTGRSCHIGNRLLMIDIANESENFNQQKLFDSCIERIVDEFPDVGSFRCVPEYIQNRCRQNQEDIKKEYINTYSNLADKMKLYLDEGVSKYNFIKIFEAQESRIYIADQFEKTFNEKITDYCKKEGVDLEKLGYGDYSEQRNQYEDFVADYETDYIDALEEAHVFDL